MGAWWIDAALFFQPPAVCNHSCFNYLLLDNQIFFTCFCECLILLQYLLKRIRLSLFYSSSSLYPTFTFLDSTVQVFLLGHYSFLFGMLLCKRIPEAANVYLNDICILCIVNLTIAMLCFVDQGCSIIYRWRRLQLFMGPRHRLRSYGQGHCAQQISSEANFLPTKMVQTV